MVPGVVGCEAVSPAQFVFLEVFRGAAGLSAAVREAGSAGFTDLAEHQSCLKHVDVGLDEDFQLLLDSQEDWMHAAPPCRSFTKARRADQYATVKVLRSVERPEGFGCSATTLANKLVNRVAEKAMLLHSSGKFFSIENPLQSYLWDLKAFVKLKGLEGVRSVRIDQCMFGSEHFKPTCILTNAPWITEVLCDRQRRPHRHVPLVGLVTDYRFPNNPKVFYTSLAAEYPDAL